MTASILALGLVAGVLTTLAGAGGGVLLVVSLSLLLGPHIALAATAPTLLVGNAHRLSLYRDRVDRSVALRVIAGALPGSLLGGALAVSIPTGALRALFAVVAAFAIARTLGALVWNPPRRLLAPVGALMGGVSATSGGAGLLLSPLLLSTGLTGEAYIATSAAVALTTHMGRLVGYGARGLLSREVLAYAGIATVAVVAGNLLGDKLRPFLDKPKIILLENGTLAVCAALAAAGLAH
ncbi:MAG TPA: TSUP family transporter [Polyangiaceae bacterium]